MYSSSLTIARSRVSVFNRAVAEGSPVVDVTPVKSHTTPEQRLKFYGGAKQLWDAVLGGEPQVMIHGPAETGKSIAVLALLDYLCWTRPGLKVSLIRKVAADMPGTVIVSYESKILGLKQGDNLSPNGVKKHGGERPEFYTYPTGARVLVGGMDHPGKILSGERDVVVVNQAEELDIGDWETISSRTTGRAGVLMPGRLIGDCNPGPSTHWIMKLGQSGVLKLIQSLHKDNPTLFDPMTGEITEQGKHSMRALDKLTGVRYKRLKLGLWVAAEGVVYENYDPTIHHRDAPLGEIIYHVAGVDWGLENPGVIQVWGIDGDGRMYRVKEVYRTGKLVAASRPEDAWWINKAKELKAQYNIKTFVCDPSRPDHMEAFELAGLDCTAAFNSVELGIQNVESRMMVQADGWPRIVILPGSRPKPDEALVDSHRPTCLEEEFEVYAYPKDMAGRPIKEEPVAAHNHSCDAMRYVAAHVDGLGTQPFFFG